MNQILSTDNNNYNNNNNKINLNKIIIFFCIAVVILALIICGVKLFSMYTENRKNNKIAKPEIEIIKEKEENSVTIKANCSEGIDYVIYLWNDDKETKINLDGSTMFERMIDIPENPSNVLSVQAVSIKGAEKQKTEIFEVGVDRTKPVIESVNIVDSKLQIIASDDIEIDYIEYQWKDEEPQTIKAESNSTTLETSIDIKRGTHELKITAVDHAGNKEPLSKIITGVNEPEINFVKYNDVVRISVEHDMGFKKIEFIINNKLYVYDSKFSEYDKNKTTVEFDFDLKEGSNIIQVNAYSLEKLSEDEAEDNLENYSFKTKKGRCTYEP